MLQTFDHVPFDNQSYSSSLPSKVSFVQNNTSLLYCIAAKRAWKNCTFKDDKEFLDFSCDPDVKFTIHKKNLMSIGKFLEGNLSHNTFVEVVNMSVLKNDTSMSFPSGFLMLHASHQDSPTTGIISFYVAVVPHIQSPSIDAIFLGGSTSKSTFYYYHCPSVEERKTSVPSTTADQQTFSLQNDFSYGQYNPSTKDMSTWNDTHIKTYTKYDVTVYDSLLHFFPREKLYWKNTFQVDEADSPSRKKMKKIEYEKVHGWEIYVLLRQRFYQYITTVDYTHLEGLSRREFDVMVKIDPRIKQSLFRDEPMYNSFQWERFLTYEFYSMFLKHRSKFLLQKNDILRNISPCDVKQHEHDEQDKQHEQHKAKKSWKENIFSVPECIAELSHRQLSVLECIRKINRISSYYVVQKS